MRKYLIIQLLLQNGSRPGPIGQLSSKHLSEAEECGSENDAKTYRLTFKRHKTSADKGSLYLYVTAELLQEMRVYYLYAWSQLKECKTAHVFLTENGRPFPSNYMSRVVREYFACIGIIKPINCTSFRKAAVTHVTDINNGTQQSDLNALMAHDSTTASKYYYVPEKKHKTLRGFQLLQRTYNTDATSFSDVDHSVEAEELDAVSVSGDSSTETVPASDDASVSTEIVPVSDADELQGVPTSSEASIRKISATRSLHHASNQSRMRVPSKSCQRLFTEREISFLRIMFTGMVSGSESLFNHKISSNSTAGKIF